LPPLRKRFFDESTGKSRRSAPKMLVRTFDEPTRETFDAPAYLPLFPLRVRVFAALAPGCDGPIRSSRLGGIRGPARTSLRLEAARKAGNRPGHDLRPATRLTNLAEHQVGAPASSLPAQGSDPQFQDAPVEHGRPGAGRQYCPGNGIGPQGQGAVRFPFWRAQSAAP